VDDVDEAIDVCNSLLVRDYWRLMPAMKENYQRGLEYHNYEYQLEKTIKGILDEDS
jgi:hypothetical protein